MPPTEAEAPAQDLTSLEGAVAYLDSLEDDTPAAPEAAAAETSTPSEGATSTPDEAAGQAENLPDGEETDAEPEAVAPAEPPKYWSQEAKAKFAELPPELQAVVLAQEGPREEATAKAKAEAAEVRAKAETELQGVQRFAEELQGFLPQAVQMFRSRWGDNPDWVAFAQANGAEAMTVARAQYDAERENLQQVAQATQVAEAKAHDAYVRGEFETLKTVAPELADPQKGPALRTEVTGYLVKQGIPPPAIHKISAVEMSLAHKAMLWDQAQAKAAAPKPAPKPTPPTTRPLARGSAAAGPSDPKAKQVQTAKSSFAQTRSVDGAVALLNALDD